MRLISNRAALVSGVLLFLIVLMAIFAPLITATSYEEQKFLMNSLAFPSQELINTSIDPTTNPRVGGNGGSQ